MTFTPVTQTTDTWIELATAVANVRSWLEASEKQHPHRNRDAYRRHHDKQNAEHDRSDVDRELSRRVTL
jgi:hypothetical protein